MNFEYKKKVYSKSVNFEDFKRVYPEITNELFEKLTGQKIAKKVERKKVTKQKIKKDVPSKHSNDTDLSNAKD
jgi:hypothetical protein